MTAKSKSNDDVIRMKPARGGPSFTEPTALPMETETTGRFLVLLKEGAAEAGAKALRDKTGVAVSSASSLLAQDASLEGPGMVFENLGVAVVDSPPDAMQSVMAEMESIASPFEYVEPERFVYALAAPVLRPVPLEEIATTTTTPAAPTPVEYLRGFRDAVNQVVDRVFTESKVVEELTEEAAAAAWNETQFTWGLQATRAHTSRFSGRGVRLAVLDTGFDLGHPDYTGRPIVSRSFVAGQAVQDGHGHGTHCIGTAAGPRQPRRQPRYGVAYNSDIYAGKVLSNEGRGTDGQILAGIEWAIINRCSVVSMSLGAAVRLGTPFSRVFEQASSRALTAGTLIVAAAGNDSLRPTVVNPVSHPANCPSILAVGALDQRLIVAPFSNGGINPQGGRLDIAAPGVGVRSSWPRPTLYNTISGTSMATPHVAGLAALLAEARPAARGLALWALIIQHARHLAQSSRDVGAGIAQAPQ